MHDANINRSNTRGLFQGLLPLLSIFDGSFDLRGELQPKWTIPVRSLDLANQFGKLYGAFGKWFSHDKIMIVVQCEHFVICLEAR